MILSKTGFVQSIALRQILFQIECGWGTWIRTKIHSSKGWCAAIAPYPSAGSIVSQKFYFPSERMPSFLASSNDMTSGFADFLAFFSAASFQKSSTFFAFVF
jgi:hypothetical protein